MRAFGRSVTSTRHDFARSVNSVLVNPGWTSAISKPAIHHGDPMRNPASLLLSSSLLLVVIPTRQPSEEAAVRAAVNQYFKGHSTARSDEMAAAFLNSAHIEGIREGVFTSWTASEYSGRFTGRAVADEASRKRTIDDVDVSGTAA